MKLSNITYNQIGFKGEMPDNKSVEQAIQKEFPLSKVATVDNVYLKGNVAESHKKLIYQESLLKRVYDDSENKSNVIDGLRNINKLFMPAMIKRGLNDSSLPTNMVTIEALPVLEKPGNLIFDFVNKIQSFSDGKRKMLLNALNMSLDKVIKEKQDNLNYWIQEKQFVESQLN